MQKWFSYKHWFYVQSNLYICKDFKEKGDEGLLALTGVKETQATSIGNFQSRQAIDTG